MKPLGQACKPRASVFEQRGKDTVYNIDDLDQIDPAEFFAENWVTDGMKVLLTEAFKRLEGKGGSAVGTFLLSQSMGGGKTHNLVALGLLAKHPDLREQVMSNFYKPGPLGVARVVRFSGRKNTEFGIWGEIADQLGKSTLFAKLYSPLQPPDPDDWVALLEGEPLLIMLDELPPYFKAAAGVAVGATHLDELTTTALANLIVAVNGGRLPNVCVVLTDLRGTAYQSDALSNLQKEINRAGGHVQIEPVKMSSNELYHILRTRLFESVPDQSEIDEVAEGYRKALDEARVMDITAASPDQIKADIVSAYPFHPAIRDLFARFKENEGYQQTRALIRIMRINVARLWESGEANDKHVVGAHDFDLHDAEMLSEIAMINNKLSNAIAHDIASQGGSAVAEQIDAQSGGNDAQDVARLIFLSSLSLAVEPVLGLNRSEIGAALAAPGRDLGRLRHAIDALQEGAIGAWYLHPTMDAKLVFRNVENLRAKLDSYTRSQLKEQRETELKSRLNDMFKTVRRDCYQDVAALPALDQVQLTSDRVTLVIFQPRAQGLPDEVREFWEHQQYKNRALFLSGVHGAYDTVLQRAAQLNASRKILDELRNENRRQDDPQLLEAEQLRSRAESQFYQSCRETFQTIWYPSKNGLTSFDLDPKYVANEYKGEEQVIQALQEVSKFREDTGADTTFKATLENKLWPPNQKNASWSGIKQRAAQDSSWLLHHPKALDELKDELVRRDIWREAGDYIERGPFEKPATSVQVLDLTRDMTSGEALLRVKPQHGDVVHYCEDGDATTASPRLDLGTDLRTKAISLSFLAVDSTGEHDTGDPVRWNNKIEVKYRFFQDGSGRCCELKAYPSGAIRYTADGSNPTGGQAYDQPFVVPEGARFILAIAEEKGVRSEQLRADVPAKIGGDEGVDVDPAKPATWKRKHQLDATGEVYSFLEAIGKYSAQLGGTKITVSRDQRWVEFRTAEEVLLPTAQVVSETTRLQELIPEGNLDLRVERLRFESGKDLEDFVRDVKTELKPGEVTQ